MSHDADRRLLHDTIATLDPEAATILMSYLPPVPWSEFATKTDLRELRTELRTEMHELRHELRGEMQELRHELRGEMHELRTEMHALGESLTGEILKLHGQLAGLGPRLVVASLGVAAALFAVTGGAVTIFG